MTTLFRDSQPLTDEQVSSLWDDIFEDVDLDWGSADCSVSLEFKRNTTQSSLLVLKHPDAGWYLEYSDANLATMVFHSAANNNASWASAFMDPNLVQDVDSDGNVWARIGLHGEEGRILQRCVASDELAEKAIRQFVKDGSLGDIEGFVDIALVKPHPMWEEWNYQSEHEQ